MVLSLRFLNAWSPYSPKTSISSLITHNAHSPEGPGGQGHAQPPPSQDQTEQIKTALHVFSRVCRKKDKKLHVPEVIFSDSLAQTTPVPAVPNCEGPCHLAHVCKNELPFVCFMPDSDEGPRYYGLSLL